MLTLLTLAALAAPTCESTETHSGEAGSFTDGSAPSAEYAHEQDLCFVVEPSCKDPAQLWFPRLQVEHGYDTVHVYDLRGRLVSGKATQEGDTFSGTGFTVYFHSDHDIAETGFEARYSCSVLSEEPQLEPEAEPEPELDVEP